MITKFHTTAYTTSEERLAASRLPKHERQELIDYLLVEYPLFVEVVDFIKNLHMPAGEGGRHGTKVIGGLLGKTRAGKSDICKYYRNRYPMVVAEDGKLVRVVYAEITSDTTPVGLAEILYTASAAESWPKVKANALISNSVRRLPMVGAQLVILDDAHFMFTDRPKNVVRNFAGLLKQLADTSALNVLLVGEESIMAFVASYDFIMERGGFPKMVLRQLTDADDEFEVFRMLLRKVDRRLPFAVESGLSDADVAADLYRYSGGVLGRVMNLVRAAAHRALRENAPRILIHHLYEEAAVRQRPGDAHEYFAARR